MQTLASRHPETGPASRSGDEGPGVDRWLWGSVILVALLFEALFALWIFGAHGGGSWNDPVDIWQTVDGGRFVAEGAFPYVYQGTNSYSLPLGFIAMAPVSVLVDLLHLGEGAPFPIPHATALLVLVPYCVLFAVGFLHAVRRLAWTMGVRRHLWATQVAAMVVALLPSFYWGHPEDVLALTFVLHAIRTAQRRAYVTSGLLLSLAISSKQWAVMVLPLLLAIAPARERRRVLLSTVALPAAFVTVTLGFDWKDAFPALFEPLTPGPHTQGHVTFFASWFGTHTSAVTRVSGVLASIPMACGLRRWCDGTGLLVVAALALAIRPLTEPISFGYYWCPAALIALCAVIAAHRRLRARDCIIPGLLVLWALPRSSGSDPGLWWAIEYGLFALLLVQLWFAGQCWKSQQALKHPDRRPILTA